ncbi:hypothetical protein N7481_001673 [Penicillium waksmanii]|uniref:uncharacterized protein n=1 Tax=Penicillium waksmanii TaxID=69791 RepID=UPI0025473D03|nr:uncharacterized protein N7481_001673 [Penicillium waksmanii]KAJ5994696.1 hypothetical protein N7481_001673 [Penicillium waksmanii]
MSLFPKSADYLQRENTSYSVFVQRIIRGRQKRSYFLSSLTSYILKSLWLGVPLQQTQYDITSYTELIPYIRGCVYLLQIDSRLRKITAIFGFNRISPLNDIIVDIGKRWKRGERLETYDWLMYLRPYLGDQSRELRAILRGAVIKLNDVVVANKNWFLTSLLQEIMDFGLDKSSTNTRIVSGLVQGSRAAIAGIENGDRILSPSRASFCAMLLSANLEIVIERSCKRVHISYWPCSFSKAEEFYLAGVPSEEYCK